MELFEELMSLAGVPLEEMKTPDISTSERDENFRKWFGKSKVVTDFYKPMIMYHGSTKAFNEFKLEYAGSTLAFGRGFYFVNDKRLAKTYAGENGTVYECYIKMEAPYIIKSPDMSFKEQLARTKIFFKNPNAREDLIKMGYDGVMVKEDDGYMEVVVFNPNQIKSTINKTFNPASDNIYESVSQVSSFKLPNGVPQSLFKLTNSMADVQKWKAKVVENNQRGVPKGSFDSVGYIMVSLIDNTIIPIARSDEHRMGFEVMDYFYSKKYGISPSNYYPIFATGNNYPYNKEDAQAMYAALVKCKSYGLDLDSIAVSMYYLSKGSTNYISASDFVSQTSKSNEDRKKLSLTKIGKSLIASLQAFSEAFEYHNARGGLSIVKIQRALNNLVNVGKQIRLNETDGYTLVTDFDKESIEDVLVRYKDGYISETDLENMIFGFDGFRNRLHNRLRKNKFSDLLQSELGNTDEVINMIGAL